MEALLTIERAAELLAISPWTVRKYISSKRIRTVRIGRRVLVEQAEIRRLIAEGRGIDSRNTDRMLPNSHQ